MITHLKLKKADKNINVDDRICQIRNSDIGSEMHFLAICPLYEPLRKHYFEDNHDLINLIKCSNKAVAFKIFNFITQATELRENVLKAHQKSIFGCQLSD